MYPGDQTLEPALPPVDVAELITTINSVHPDGSDAALIDQISLLEHLKSSCAAAQATLTQAFTAGQIADGAARNIPSDRTRRSIAGQIALARRESRQRGGRLVGLSAALATLTPQLLAALRSGDLSEHRADLIFTEFACLTPADITRADAVIGPDLAGLSDGACSAKAAGIAARLDPEAVMAKIRGAVTDRHVSCRPAPDTMSRLSALLPVAQGVAVVAALRAAADTATASPGGDRRTRGQLMADTLVSLVTGQQLTGCDPYGVPVYAPGASASAEAPTPTQAGAATGGAADGSHPGPAPETAPNEADMHESDDLATDIDLPAEADSADDDDAAAAAKEADTSTHPGGSTDLAASADLAASTDLAASAELAGSGAAGGVVACACGNTAARPAGLQINLIMTDRTLLGGDDEPAHLRGPGPIPAPLARALVIGNADTDTRTFVRRLYTDPDTGQLVAMDSKKRLFPAGAQRFLIARDQTCRTPWCDAPIRHLDHIVPHADGGPTAIDNGQGLCAACNLTKEAPAWHSNIFNTIIRITTPTGHSYRSRPPKPPSSPPWPTPDISWLETGLTEILLDAA